MADDSQNASDLSDPIAPGSPREDAETKATRKELKQTAISDKAKTTSAGKDDAAVARTHTPELDAPATSGDTLKEQVSSPKKKRGHDEVDEQRDADNADSASSAAVSERDKKRQRDGQATEDDKAADQAGASLAADKAKDATSQTASTGSPKKGDAAPATTSTSAFASSGFSKLTGTASPFGALGGASKPSVFGGANSTTSGSASPFGSVGSAAAAAKPAAPSLSFGNKPGASSPFATLNGPSTSTFGGSAFGSGFGSALSGAKLSSFGKPGEVFKSDKPAKPFGAPDSDAEEEGDEGEEGSEEADESVAEEAASPEKEKEEPKVAVDDKKKPKLQKVSVDDGEAGEATIFSARTRLYYLDKTLGWKERGAGIIKVNVPEASVEFDEAGVAIPASFDASVLDEEDDEESGGERKSKVVRLILRQDSTHRVILNTVIVPATDFQKRTTLKYTTVLFPAFEGEDAKPVSMQMKLSEANAENFIQLMIGIQKELRGE